MRLVVLLLLAGTVPASAQTPSSPWDRVPTMDDVRALPEDENSRLIRLGIDFIMHTTEVAKEYVGNQQQCVNCHLPGPGGLPGTRPNGMPLTVANIFAKGVVIPREGRLESLAERGLVGCMERSEHGKAIPEDSKLGKAFLAYVSFISQPFHDGEFEGRGTPKLPMLNRAADPVKGKGLYAANCAACHGFDGQGREATSDERSAGYPDHIPSLWGPYGPGGDAGIARVDTLAPFIAQNMPFVPGDSVQVLTPEIAWDIAAYVDSQPHPMLPQSRLDKDYPGKYRYKKVSVPYGPYPVDDPFPPQQHKFGPWPQIIKWMNENTPKE